MGYEAKILVDSVTEDGCRLTTFQVTFPRIVLAEFNTHRMLSRNSASSRAIPVEKRIAAVEADPFVPDVFGLNRPGMQATEAVGDAASLMARDTWVHAMRDAVERARTLATLGVHKQLANRLLEPFLWHTVIVSATDWSNALALRCHPDAQPECRRPFEMIRDLLASSTPNEEEEGEWHIPMCGDFDQLVAENFTLDEILRIAVGRCARVSYLTHDGRRDPREDLALANRIEASGHMSPFEHVAQAMSGCLRCSARIGNFVGWSQYRKHIRNEDDFGRILAQRAADAIDAVSGRAS
jgi:hypothetical protein